MECTKLLFIYHYHYYYGIKSLSSRDVRMKYWCKIALLWLYTWLMFVPLAAIGWWEFSGDPFRILDEVASEANDENRIQETALDDTSQFQWSYPLQYRLANTLDAIRQQIWPYLEWAFFLGLSIAVIWIIINGLLLVTHSAHGKGDLGEIKKRLTNIALGVVVLVWVYAIIRILNAVLARVLW
jgi:hypothetical protein